MRFKAIKSENLEKLSIFLSFFPVGIMMFIQSLGWPNNFDDFYRGFNGINPDHNVLSYGWIKSEEMVKHIIHDPLLVWSNQLDYRFLIQSGVIEIMILMYIMKHLSFKGNQKSIVFSMIVVFIFINGV